jgi:prophage DNA circulation protein
METFIASIDNFVLNIMDISDTVSHALVKYEFINTNGAVIDNMGRRPHEIKFRAYFFGYKYENIAKEDPTYLNHFFFIQSIADPTKSHVLTHPKYGEIKGYVDSYTINHDDTQNYVTIDIAFIEKDIQGAGLINSDQIGIAGDLQAQIDMVQKDLDTVNNELTSGGFQALIGAPLDFSRKLSEQFTNVTAPCRAFLKDCDTFLTQTDMFMSNITAPLTSINNAVNFTNDVPSRLLGSINSACDRLFQSFVGLSNLPTQFINNATTGLLNFHDTITGGHAEFFQTHFIKLAAASLAVQTGNVLVADESSRDLALTQEHKKSFDVAGNRVNSVKIPTVLSSVQLDDMLFTVRNFIQMAIVADRDNQNLKDMAANLINYVNNVKLKKQSQVTMTTSNIPLHLFCLQMGLPYNAVNRIALLNKGITNPTFTEGTLQTYVS